MVEAGVDLNFKHMYRQINGLDSIIQAAGRCNREGEEDKNKSIVHVFDLKDEKIPQNQRQQIGIAKGILYDYDKINDLEAINDYFKRLYHFRGESLDKKHIMGEFQKRRYNFAEVAKKFKLIEQETKTIFIHKEPEAEELLQELKEKGISKDRMRKLQQYCVQVYANGEAGNSHFEKLQNAGMIRPISEDIQDLYELISEEQYSERYGLDLEIDGEAAFFL